MTDLRRDKYSLEASGTILKITGEIHDRLPQASRQEIERWLVDARSVAAVEVDLSDVRRMDTWAEGLLLPLLVALCEENGSPIVVRIDQDRLYLFAGLHQRLRQEPVAQLVYRDGRPLEIT